MKVTAPNKNYSGHGYGIDFIDGVGYIDDEATEVIETLQQRGYKVTEEVEPQTGEAVKDESPRPHGNASKDEWHTYAISVGVSAADVDGKTRAQIIEAVDALAVNEPTHPLTEEVEPQTGEAPAEVEDAN